MSLPYEELTSQVIRAALDVHRILGPSFLESVYQKALEVELSLSSIPFTRKRRVEVEYRGTVVGRHEIDLFVADLVVVELKATTGVDNVHFAVVRSYLRALDREHGLILNFAKSTLEIRRVVV